MATVHSVTAWTPLLDALLHGMTPMPIGRRDRPHHMHHDAASNCDHVDYVPAVDMHAAIADNTVVLKAGLLSNRSADPDRSPW